MYNAKAADQKERLAGQAKRKCSVVSREDLHIAQTGSGGSWSRLCKSSLVTTLPCKIRNQVFLAFNGMRSDQKSFHVEGANITRGGLGGVAEGRDL